MKRTLTILTVIAVLAGLVLVFFRPALAAGPANLLAQPRYGWTVCSDLGIGSVPGLGIVRQRFSLCTADGWEVRAYCLEPDKDAPGIGTVCSETGAGDYWCGDDVQILRRYAIAATPRPAPTATRRPTVRAPTATATRVIAAPTITRTPRVGLSTSTPPPTVLPTVIGPRPQPGGPGNLGWLLIFGASAAGLVITQTLLVAAARRR